MDNKPKTQKKAWIYARTNTNNQDALRSQVEILVAEAKRQGCTITGISYDLDTRGEPLCCHGVQHVQEAVLRGEVDVILLTGGQINRFIESQPPILKLLEENDVCFYIKSTDKAEKPPLRHKRKRGAER